MHYANTIGLPYVCARLNEFAVTASEPRHAPAPLLARLAAEGRRFE
jgi:hypothetical protein